MGKDAPKPLTAKGILRKGVKLFWRSCKRLHFILIIPLLSYFVYSGSSSFNASSIQDFLMTLKLLGEMAEGSLIYDALLESILNDFLQIARAFSIEFWSYTILSSFIGMTILYTVAMLSENRKVTIMVLAFRIRTTWVGLLETNLYVYFLTTGYLSSCLLLMGTATLIGGVSVASFSLIVVMAILVSLLFVHLNMLWSQGVVVSVMEEGRSGLNALGRAAERVRGMKGLGFRLNILVFLLAILAHMLIPTVTALLPLPNLISLIIRSLVFPLVNVLIQAVNVAFYFECQENQKEAATRKDSLTTQGLQTKDHEATLEPEKMEKLYEY